jgi:uncharacterized protein
MAKEYKTPGVYIEEISKLPPSVASVETAIPAFIGYTEKATADDNNSLNLVAGKISSLLEYEKYFGFAPKEQSIALTITEAAGQPTSFAASIATPSVYQVYHGLQMFFGNGGGPCYIISVGGYETPELIESTKLKEGLRVIEGTDEVTLIVFPDAISLPSKEAYYGLFKESLLQCSLLQDRFAIMDIWIDRNTTSDNIKALRESDLGTTNELKYGAVYYPKLISSLNYFYNDTDVSITHISLKGTTTHYNLAALAVSNPAYYTACKNEIQKLHPVLPVSPSIAGVYTMVDNTRGVWKAPANINLVNTIHPLIAINDQQQQLLNIDTATGRSINSIRSFAGRGNAIVWGARTLAGNDNEWRYISIRRFFMMAEESIKKATEQFVFEPNDAGTWTRIKSMIENYLTLQWKAGALMGSTTREAYFVHCGLAETMTESDILEGRLIVEIGMAAVRPAEFIILRFMHKMLKES